MNDIKLPTLIRKSVCCLLINPEGLVLAVSRTLPVPMGLEKDYNDVSSYNSKDILVRPDRSKWGLPGGKVERFENFEEDLITAVTRETFEETGYIIANPVPVRTRVATTMQCTTFTANIASAVPDAPRSLPFEGDVEWVIPFVLCHNSPFSNYNRALFESLGMEWKFTAAYGGIPEGWTYPGDDRGGTGYEGDMSVFRD